MKTQSARFVLIVVAGLGLAGSHLFAAATAEHRKQITEIGKDVTKAKGLIGKKDFDEAAKLLDEAEKKLKQVVKDADIKEADKLVAGTFKQITESRALLGKKRPSGGSAGGGAGGFERDVAPILVARCLNCHGNNNPRANLRMDTFAGIIAGGDSGALIVPGKPDESPLVQRITATGNERMPKNARPLADDEIKKITDWVASGAKFNGLNTTPLSQLKGTAETIAKVDNTPVSINKPTGNETVSFTKDIAPFMVNLCLNCHSGNDPRAGFSMETFEKLMRGGKSGRVVLPGNTEDSRLWQLAGKQDPIKMPPGNQVMITVSNHSNLRKWIEEGAKFDGPDPKATLRSLVPTEAEKRAKELASLSDADFAKRRKDRAEQLWNAALASDAPAVHENDSFIVMGNVGEPRVKQVAEWAGPSAERLRKLFKIKDASIWRGKLTIFVFKDRFSYAEFTQTNENVEIPPETKSHSRVSASLDEAYVCLLDIGDSVTEDSPGVKTLLMGLLAEGYMQLAGNRIPEWAAKGTGLMLASQTDPKNPYFRGLTVATHSALRAINKPDELFVNGTFSPADLPAVGFTLVSFMLKKGGDAYFVDFLKQLMDGKTLNDALKSVYNVDVPGLAQAFATHVESLPGSKAAAKKKK